MRRIMAVLVASGLVCGCGATMKKAPAIAEEAAAALAAGDNAGALALARHGLVEWPGDAWLRYDEGCALAGLGRVDEALPALRAAERAFPDGYSKSLAVYRRAVALESSGRCPEAVREFIRYGAFVASSD